MVAGNAGDGRTDGRHQLAERRSLELHALVAQKLLADASVLSRTRNRVAAWLRDGTVARPLAEAWRQLLARPLPEIVAALEDPAEPMCRLRQSSPFAGVIGPRARWDVWRRTRPAEPRR